MSIVIRHGSNGAFKTANSVGEYLIPAIQQGRVVVTNIRGVSRQRCYEKFSDLPESMDIIYVDTQTTEGRLHMAKWFHWAPPGALLIFDEASSVFPKSWRQSDLDKLDYPGGTDKAKEDDRPENWLQAFEMHRHWNWDIVLTTPNIKNIRDDIRNTTEMAYRQRNLGSLSEKLGRFKEVQHDAAKNGFSASDAISMTVKKVNKDAFDLYDSTTTGIVKGSQAGQSLLKNPKVLLLLGVLMACLGTVVYLGAPGFTGEPDTTTNTSKSAETTGQVVAAAHVPGPEMVPRVHPGKVVGVPHDRLPNGLSVAGVPVVDPFSDYQLRITGTINDLVQIEATKGDDTIFLDRRLLFEMGYVYYAVNDCIGRLVWENQARLVMCSSRDEFREEQDGKSEADWKSVQSST